MCKEKVIDDMGETTLAAAGLVLGAIVTGLALVPVIAMAAQANLSHEALIVESD